MYMIVFYGLSQSWSFCPMYFSFCLLWKWAWVAKNLKIKVQQCVLSLNYHLDMSACCPETFQCEILLWTKPHVDSLMRDVAVGTLVVAVNMRARRWDCSASDAACSTFLACPSCCVCCSAFVWSAETNPDRSIAAFCTDIEYFVNQVSWNQESKIYQFTKLHVAWVQNC